MDQEQIDKILKEHRTKNFVQRILNPENAPEPLIVEGQKQTHFMSAEFLGEEDKIPAVFPRVIETEEGELTKLSLEEAKNHARTTGEYIEFDSIVEADNFSQNYKGPQDSGFNQFYSPESNEGLMSGETMNKKMKKEMYHGGMMMPEMIVGIDEVSGNEIPPGSDAENVRDDIPAALSEGELVIPADVVRYHGLKAYEDMRMEAKMGLMSMMAEGQIVSLDEEESTEEEYDEDYEMNPTDHVEKNEDTGMYCVYDNDGNKVKEFKTKKEANEYAKQNHDELMASSNVEEVEVSVEEEGMDLKEDSEGVKSYPTEKDDIDMMELGDSSIIKLFVKGLMGR